MGFLGSVYLLMMGVLCCSDEITKKYPQLRLWIESTSPFHPYLGLVALGYAIIALLSFIFNLDQIFSHPLLMLAKLATSIIALGIGFLFSGSVLINRLEKVLSEENKNYLQQQHTHILSYQAPLGYAALWLGAFWIMIFLFDSTNLLLQLRLLTDNF